ncbi:hypothetical protein A6A08_18030 [Nocardiopsis sp. TSRI0078]|uniref:DUF3995 domain-containing protein n=1 Tax=unclassified Nocardiopsis TaxID=2649073 RepID=UPI000969694C|nr:DUF3995 domain-containing protein [Nocardiopsis sp. TSRI0078]OKI22860.1 hypothetical protein A6A08_18030 [Nocardiopsis sp. TSRI0078]
MNSWRPKSSTAAWAGAVALLPYAVMKTYWAFGGTAGRPAGDLAEQLRAHGAPEALVWMERHGLDFTVLGALAGAVLLVALVLPWGTWLPRWVLLVPGWAGAVLLTPYGLATMVAAPLGFTVGDAEGWSWWVGLVAGAAFAGLGAALGVCSWSCQRRTGHRPGAGPGSSDAVGASGARGLPGREGEAYSSAGPG